MASCGPTCTVPSCASVPTIGIGSGPAGARGLGYTGLGSYGGLSYGYGGGALGSGGSTSSGQLGTVAGVLPQPISQIPSSEVVIQPRACVVTFPGAVLSSSCEPISVGGYSPGAAGGSGFGGSGLLGSGLSGGWGYGSYGLGGRRSLWGHCGNICY